MSPVRPLILDGQPQTWTAADRALVKRWLAKVYLGVRVRASTLHVDPKDASSATIASQQEIDDAEMLRMVVRGQVTIPHSSLFVYDCDPTSPAGEDFDFFASDEATVVAMRTESVGLVCILLDGQSVEDYATAANPLVKAQAQRPLGTGHFRMVMAYALAGAVSADVGLTMETAGTNRGPEDVDGRLHRTAVARPRRESRAGVGDDVGCERQPGWRALLGDASGGVTDLAGRDGRSARVGERRGATPATQPDSSGAPRRSITTTSPSRPLDVLGSMVLTVLRGCGGCCPR